MCSYIIQKLDPNKPKKMHCLHQSCTHYVLMGTKKQTFLHLSKKASKNNIGNFMARTWWLRIPRCSAQRLTPSAEQWPPSLQSASSSGSSGCAMVTTPGWTQTYAYIWANLHLQNITADIESACSSISSSISNSTVWSCSRIVINMEI